MIAGSNHYSDYSMMYCCSGLLVILFDKCFFFIQLFEVAKPKERTVSKFLAQ